MALPRPSLFARNNRTSILLAAPSVIASAGIAALVSGAFGAAEAPLEGSRLISGDATIRAPFGASDIEITTTSRLAGAIHSVRWNGREFIDSADHGRQLQSASSFDNTPEANPETFNPTEAGSRDDGAGARSTSRLLALQTDGSSLRTTTQMAFWLAPGERSGGQLARNSERLSGHILTKEVRIGAFGMPNVLDCRVTFHVPEVHTAAQFEALTGYMPADFSEFWRFVSATGQLEPITDGPGEIADPVVLATPDGNFAMGVVSLDEPPSRTTGPTYGRFRFTKARVVKWNCVFRLGGGVATGDYAFQIYVPLGTREDVRRTLQALVKRRSPSKDAHQRPSNDAPSARP